jgi:hypothetical protein
MFDLNIDDLRKQFVDIHFFGLGFIQVKVSDERRFHFYHKALPAFVDTPHNHRYNFTSNVINGRLTNYIWRETSDGPQKGVIERVSCRKDEEIDPQTRHTTIECESLFLTCAGSGYYLQHNVLHSVVPDLARGPVVTHIMRGPIVKEYADAFRPEGLERVCPFSRNMKTQDLWLIVEECLKEPC